MVYKTICDYARTPVAGVGLLAALAGTPGCENTSPKNHNIEDVVKKNEQYSTQQVEEIKNSKYHSETGKNHIIETYYRNPQEAYTNLNPESKKAVDNFDANNLSKKSKELIKEMFPWINLNKPTLPDKLFIIEEDITEPDFKVLQ